MGEITRDEIRERMGNIDQIRDILFGPKLQEYNSRLNKLESAVALLEKDIRDRTEKVKADCLAELQVSMDSLEQKISSLALTSQNDNADLRQLIDRTYRNFYGSIESIDKTVGSQTNSIRQDLADTKEKLQDDIQSLKYQLFDELEKRFSLLKSGKISRDEVADMLFELSLKLKKTEFHPDLKETNSQNGSDELRLIEASKASESTEV